MPARVFVAIELRQSTRALLGDATEALLATDPSWRGEKQVAPHLLHVTVLFLGAVPDGDMPETLHALALAAASASPFELHLSGARAVPDAHRASMVWATLDGAGDEASALADALSSAAGLDPDPRPFRPHVTLLRARAPRRLDRAATGAATSVLSDSDKGSDRIVSVRSVTVFSSTLDRRGPTYESLARLDLSAVSGQASAR